MISADSVSRMADAPVAMFSAPGHQDTIWSDVRGTVVHSKMIKWTGGVAATHAIGTGSGAAEVRTRSLELHFSWNSGVAEADAESGKRVWAYKNRPRYGLILPPGTNVEFRIKEKSNYRFLAMELEPEYLLRAAEFEHLSAVEFIEAWEYDNQLVWALAEAIFKECDSEARQGLLYSETAVTLLALHVARNLSDLPRQTKFLRRGGLPPAILRGACDFMASRMGDDVSLSEIARAVGLSTGHFTFAFKKSM